MVFQFVRELFAKLENFAKCSRWLRNTLRILLRILLLNDVFRILLGFRALCVSNGRGQHSKNVKPCYLISKRVANREILNLNMAPKSWGEVFPSEAPGCTRVYQRRWEAILWSSILGIWSDDEEREKEIRYKEGIYKPSKRRAVCRPIPKP